jgi:D-aminopeptidase
MKLFVSSDIEGTCGIAHWDETEIGKPGYDRFPNR